RNFVTFVLTDDLIERLRCARTALRLASFLLEGMLARGRPPVGNQHEARIIGRCRTSTWTAGHLTCTWTSRSSCRDRRRAHPPGGPVAITERALRSARECAHPVDAGLRGAGPAGACQAQPGPGRAGRAAGRLPRDP